MNSKLGFSVILPVCHGGDFLRDALVSLKGSKYPRDSFEALVIGLEDDKISREIVEKESFDGFDFKYIGSSNTSLSARLNAACNAARSRILAFADDDCIIMPEWLKTIDDVLRYEPDVGAIGGHDMIVHSESSFDLALDFILNSFFGAGGVRGKAGRLRIGKYYPRLWNMAIPRSVAEAVSLGSNCGSSQIFNESLAINQDVELMDRIQQLGKRIVFVPKLGIKHRRDTTLMSFIKRNFNMARTCRSLGIHRVAHIGLSLSLIGILCLAVFSVFLQPLRMLLLLFAGIYAVVLFINAIYGFLRTGKIMVLLLIPLLFLSLHTARGLGYLFPLRKRNHNEVGV